MKRRRALPWLMVCPMALELGTGSKAQTSATIGFLCGASATEWAPFVRAFRDGLAGGGYAEGRNLMIDYRFADGRYERLPAMARALVDRGVAVIVATAGATAARAARQATSRIPIVFTLGTDPVALGLVASLARPGGNLTGAMVFAVSLMSKRLELLRELLPRSQTLAVMVNTGSASMDLYVKESQAAARRLGVVLQVLEVRDEEGIAAAFDRARAARAAGIVVSAEPLFDTHRLRLVALARKYAMPAIYGFREYVAAGVLLSYGPSLSEAYRQAGTYTAQILDGARPAELPVVQPTRFELVVNGAAAAALGLTLPQSLLLRADEVIE